MAKTMLQSGDITVGKKLLWDAFDHNGVLLLKKGHIVQNERQLNSLLERGLYRLIVANDAEEAETVTHVDSPFLLLDDTVQGLARLFGCIDYDNYTITTEPEKFTTHVLKLCRKIQEVCEQDADAALGAIHLYQEGDYVCYHPIHSAILSELVGQRMRLSPEQRTSLLAAAVTQNLSIVKLQHKLNFQKEKLTPEQDYAIKQHTHRSLDILKSAGIDDKLWLQCVDHHHEKLDGSGYPHQLAGEALDIPSQILGLSDRYGAMVSGRAYRDAIPAKEALREFFLSKNKEYDEELILAFIKELGIYPPGCIVKLKNGETAVVIRRQCESVWPIVASIWSPRGGPYTQPIERDSDEDQYMIVDVVARDKSTPLNLHMIWGY